MSGFLISGFILSLLNVAVSGIFKRFYPKEINDFVGYRTPRSMRSKKAWDFANRYSSDLMFKCSLVVFLLQFLLYLILEAETAMLTVVGLWISGLVFTILRTEMRLKQECL